MVSSKYFKLIQKDHNRIVKEITKPSMIIGTYFTLCGYCKNAKWVNKQDYGYCSVCNNRDGSCFDGMIWYKDYKSDISTNGVYVHKPENINCEYFNPNICYCKGIIHYDKCGNLMRHQHTMCKETHFKEIMLPIVGIIIAIISLITSIWSILK